MRGERTGASPGTNMQFALLSALGIFFVADGHLNNSYLDIGGLIPYYSFHMQLFVFISGYFCREEQERFASYGIRKFKRLMLPYFAWNLVYGILAAFLRGYGFSFGDPVSLETLFAEPFRTGYQFILNHPAWFVPALFLVELADRAVTVLARPGMAKLAAREAAGDRTAARAKFLFYLLLGLGGIWISRHVGTDGFWLTLVRLLFLLPFYGAGILYRRELEAKDKLKSPVYFGIILLAAMALILRGRPVIYAVSHCRDFPGYLSPYLSAFLGIAFWLRVSRILTPAVRDNSFIRYMGRNTYPIMMHHMMVLFGIRTVFALFAKYAGIFTGFDFEAYKTDFYYCYFPRGMVQLRVFYLLAALFLPLGLKWVTDRLRRDAKRMFGRRTAVRMITK